MGGFISTSNKSTDQGDCLQLVLYVLPIIKELTRYLERDLDPRDKRYGYLGNVYTAAIILDGHLREIEEAGNANSFMGQISKLADLLEEIFNENVINVAQLQLSQDTPYRRLRAVQKLVPKNDGWETRLKELQLVSIARRLVAWDELQRNLEEISDELQKFGEDALGIDKPRLPTTSPDTASELMAFADRVFSALSCNECESESQYKVRLRIGTCRNGRQDQRANVLCILLAQYSHQNVWHEAVLHDIQQSRQTSRARFAGIEAIEATPSCMETWYIKRPKSHPCICSLLNAPPNFRYDYWRLNMVLDPTGAGFQSHKPDERTYKQELLQQEVNLKTLLASQAKDWTAMTKFTLALILSYSLFHLYGGSWAKDRWSRKNIVFFGDGKYFPLRPFLSSDPQKLDGPLHDPEGYHKYPEFLELGVILLEIHLGQRLESYLGREADISNYDELLFEALRIFHDKRQDFISVVYRDSIEKCLHSDFSVSDTCDEQMLRDSLFKDIVKPLETEVGRAFQEFISLESLDEDAEKKINLGSNGYHYQPDPEIAKAVHPSLNFKPNNLYPSLDDQLALPQHQEVLVVPAVASPRPASRCEFEIGIICVLPLEYDAVFFLMDELWDDEGDKYGRAAGDLNTYTTGRIGKYNVVLVLSGMGKASTASAAATLRSSFSGLRLVLLTGICGGVPNPGTVNEVVLGDVVLSASVVQYDFGRLHSDKFVPKDTWEHSLSRPTKDVRNLLHNFATERGRRLLEKRAAFFLNHVQESSQTGQTRKYQYPGAAEDKLFRTIYIHKHRGSSECFCEMSHESTSRICDKSRKLSCDELQCDEQYLVQRERIKKKLQLEREGRRNEAQAPAIFIGRIGSGDMVVKSGEDRDRIAKSHGLIAFEMEGAGAWDELPCIVVKGICDYADSHKNKVWQHFAAATAASVMKALLERYTQTDKILTGQTT